MSSMAESADHQSLSAVTEGQKHRTSQRNTRSTNPSTSKNFSFDNTLKASKEQKKSKDKSENTQNFNKRKFDTITEEIDYSNNVGSKKTKKSYNLSSSSIANRTRSQTTLGQFSEAQATPKFSNNRGQRTRSREEVVSNSESSSTNTKLQSRKTLLNKIQLKKEKTDSSKVTSSTKKNLRSTVAVKLNRKGNSSAAAAAVALENTRNSKKETLDIVNVTKKGHKVAARNPNNESTGSNQTTNLGARFSRSGSGRESQNILPTTQVIVTTLLHVFVLL